MSSTKRISGDYNITNKDVFGANITISTHTLTIDGNLLVGNITNATVTNTDVEDNIITLNKGETGSGVTLGNAGIAIDRGSSSTVMLRWNEAIDSWQVTSDGSTYANIATTSGSGTTLSNVYADSSPRLGGNLNITSRTLYDTGSNVTIYAGTPAGGGSGVFANTATTSNQELVTKTKAIVYALIM
jgi:hypothetical protein